MNFDANYLDFRLASQDKIAKFPVGIQYCMRVTLSCNS